MDFKQFKDWAFLGLISGGVFVLFLMYQSVSELNTKIAVVIERTEMHKAQLEKHDERIRQLEINTNNGG